MGRVASHNIRMETGKGRRLELHCRQFDRTAVSGRGKIAPTQIPAPEKIFEIHPDWLF